MRDHGGQLSFQPRLPGALTALKFRIMFCGRSLLIEVNRTEAHYTLVDGEPLDIHHFGKAARVTGDEPLVRQIPPIQLRPAPRQPPGREPTRWRAARVEPSS